MDVTVSVLLVIWVVFFAWWWITALRNRSPFKRQPARWGFLTSMALPLAVVSAAVFLLAPDLAGLRLLPGTPAFSAAGVIVTCAGLAFAVLARLHLGKNWSGRPAIREDHTLIRTGPYGIVRHPIYTGILAGMLGTAIALGFFVSFFLIAVVLAAFLVKIRMEEQFLGEEFGGEYRQYCREVKALIPWIL